MSLSAEQTIHNEALQPPKLSWRRLVPGLSLGLASVLTIACSGDARAENSGVVAAAPDQAGEDNADPRDDDVDPVEATLSEPKYFGTMEEAAEAIGCELNVTETQETVQAELDAFESGVYDWMPADEVANWRDLYRKLSESTFSEAATCDVDGVSIFATLYTDEVPDEPYKLTDGKEPIVVESINMRFEITDFGANESTPAEQGLAESIREAVNGTIIAEAEEEAQPDPYSELPILTDETVLKIGEQYCSLDENGENGIVVVAAPDPDFPDAVSLQAPFEPQSC